MPSRKVKDLFNKFVDLLQAGDTFQPRWVVTYINIQTLGSQEHNIPHDGTITRYIRERRTQRHDIELANKSKSIYRKV